MDKRQFFKTLLAAGTGLYLDHSMLGSVSKELSSFTYRPIKTKFQKEAMFYTISPKGTQCGLCPKNCDLTEGESGICRSRVSKGGKLWTLAYGNPCAVHVDPIEKKPLNHFIPGTKVFSVATAGCNMECLYCQNWSISQKSPDETRNMSMMPNKVIENCKEQRCSTIAYTYTEPVSFYEYAYDTSVLARQAGLKNVILSAGYINKEPLLKLCKVIDAFNIDLKSFNNEIYEKLNAGLLQPVLDNLKIIRDEGVWLEITNLVVPTWTDDFDMIKKMCNWLVNNGFSETPIHFNRFFPQYRLNNLSSTRISVLNQARNIAIREGLKYAYVGNVPGTEFQNTACPNCGENLIDRQNYMILQNNIQEGHCRFCGYEIKGVW